jgi:hypothetical protein
VWDPWGRLFDYNFTPLNNFFIIINIALTDLLHAGAYPTGILIAAVLISLSAITGTKTSSTLVSFQPIRLAIK